MSFISVFLTVKIMFAKHSFVRVKIVFRGEFIIAVTKSEKWMPFDCFFLCKELYQSLKGQAFGPSGHSLCWLCGVIRL